MYGKLRSILEKKGGSKVSIDRESFEGYNPVEEIDEGFIISVDGMVYRAWEMQQPFLDSRDEAAFEGAARSFAGILKDLPKGLVLHKQDIFWEVFKKDELETDGFFEKIKRDHLFGSPVLDQVSYLYVGLPANSALVNKNPNALNTTFTNGVGSNPFDNLSSVLSTFDQQVSALISSMEGHGVKFKSLGDDEIEQNFYNYFNLDFNGEKKELKGGFYSRGSNFIAADKVVGISSFDGPNQKISSSLENEYAVAVSFLDPVLHGLPFEHVVNQVIRIPKQDQIKNQLQRNMNSFATGNKETKMIGAGLGEFLNDIEISNDLLLYYGFNVIYYTNDIDKLGYLRNQVRNGFEKIYTSFKTDEGIEDLANMFWGNAPGNAHQNYRVELYPASHVGCYFSLGQYQEGTPGFLVKDRLGRPLYINVEGDDPKEAQNWVVVGPTGGGKSFLINVIITYFLEKMHEVIMIDKGGSYIGMCNIFGGKYYDFNDLSEIKMNPFIISKDRNGKYVLSTDNLIGIKSLLKIIWRFDQGGGLSNNENTVLDTILFLFYEKMNNQDITPGMDTFIEFLKDLTYGQINEELDLDDVDLRKEEYFKKEELLLNLAPFRSKSKGQYAMLFNSTESTTLAEEQLIVFDVANLSSDPLLFSLMTVAIMNVVTEKLKGRRHIRKHVMMDEASEVLGQDIGKFMRTKFREIRKENGDVGTIVQLITDLTEHKTGQVIIDNSTKKFLLDHSQATKSLPKVKQGLELTDQQFNMLKSLNKKPNPNHREFWYNYKGRVGVFALEVPEKLRIAFSSEAGDRETMDKLIKLHRNPRIAIKEYMENQHSNN